MTLRKVVTEVSILNFGVLKYENILWSQFLWEITKTHGESTTLWLMGRAHSLVLQSSRCALPMIGSSKASFWEESYCLEVVTHAALLQSNQWHRHQLDRIEGKWNAIISDIKDIKKEETESRLGRNYTDLYKICLNIYSWLNSFKVKYIFQSMYLNR